MRTTLVNRSILRQISLIVIRHWRHYVVYYGKESTPNYKIGDIMSLRLFGGLAGGYLAVDLGLEAEDDLFGVME